MEFVDAVMVWKDWVMDECTQAKRRMGEKGHPGAEGMDRVLRKWIAEVRCEQSVICSAWDKGVMCVTKGLNIQI
jgi:hypothetical protein